MIKANNLDSCLILCGFVMVTLIAYFHMSYQLPLLSAVFMLSFFWIFIIVVRSFIKYKSSRLLPSVIVCMLLSTLHVASNIYAGGFEYFNKLIMFVCFILLVYVNSIYVISKKVVLCVFAINIVLSLFYILFYIKGDTFVQWEFLTLNFSNPNLTGMFLANSFIYILLFSISRQDLGYNKWLCLIMMPLAGFLFYLITFTGSRGAILTAVGFVVIVLVDVITRKIRPVKGVIALWAIVPLLFVFIYVNFKGSLGGESILVNDEQGKSSDTRMIVWKPGLEMVKNNLLFGDYYGVGKGRAGGFNHLHNTHLEVLACYGLIPFVLFVYILYKAVSSVSRKSSVRFNRYAVWAFMSCFISGLFEAALVSGGACLYVLTCGFLLLANSEV